MTNEELVEIYENRILEHIKVAAELANALDAKFREGKSVEKFRDAIDDVEHEISGIRHELWQLRSGDDEDDNEGQES